MHQVSDRTVGSGGIDLALVHYPVYNKHREVVGSAVTNLDIHDIARACRTFGVDNFFLVTPFSDQQELVKKIIHHWQKGRGAVYNNDRQEALSTISIWSDLVSLYRHIAVERESKTSILATCAQPGRDCLPYPQARKMLEQHERFLLLFGTAWGLTDEVIAGADAVLPPIKGREEYNHLSVRSAVSIILDRLLSDAQ